MHHKLHTAQYTMHSTQCTFYNAQYTMHSIQCSVHIAQYIMHKLLASGTKVCPLFPHGFNNRVFGRSEARGPKTSQNQFCSGFGKAVFPISVQVGFPETGPGNPETGPGNPYCH